MNKNLLMLILLFGITGNQIIAAGKLAADDDDSVNMRDKEPLKVFLDHSGYVKRGHVNGKGKVTALHIAASKGQAAATQLLLDNGAPMLPTINGTMPLHLAVMSGSIATVEVLLNFGANPHDEAWDYKDARDRAVASASAFQVAEAEGYTEILALLKTKQNYPLINNPFYKPHTRNTLELEFFAFRARDLEPVNQFKKQ